MPNDASTKSEYNDIHDICSDGWRGFLQQANIDLDYYFRAQHSEEEASRARDQDRELYTIDKIGRQVNLLHGYEIRNRHILKIGPHGSPDLQEDIACGQHTKTLMSLMARHGGYDVLSEGFKWGTLIQGSNLIEIWRDRNGDLQFSRLGYNQFLLNPALTRTDLSDCDDIQIGRWLGKNKVKRLLPTADLNGIQPALHASRWQYLGNPALGNKAELRLYEEWWHRDTDFEDTVISRVTGQEMPLAEFARQFYNGDERLAKYQIENLRLPNGMPNLSRFNKPVDVINLKVFVDEELQHDGENPLGMRDYNHVWIHGDFCAECPRSELKLQGFTRKLRDPQRALNRRTNQIYDIIEVAIQGLRLARAKYIQNPEDAWKAGQGITLVANEEYPDDMPLAELFAQIPASEVPATLFQALEMTDKAETDTGGLNQEIFGSDDANKEVPALLGRFRTGQALTGQQGMFTGFRNAKRQLGVKSVRLTQLNYGPNKIRRIINESPAQGFYQKDLAKYDCTPVEGLLTENQQELFHLYLQTLRGQSPENAALIPLSEQAKYSPTPFKPELLEIIKRGEQKQEQMAQMQAEQAKRDADLQNAITATQVARTMEDTANAAESRSEIPLNQAETLAKIQKMQAEPIVSLIKEQVRLQIAQEKAKQGVSK